MTSRSAEAAGIIGSPEPCTATLSGRTGQACEPLGRLGSSQRTKVRGLSGQTTTPDFRVALSGSGKGSEFSVTTCLSFNSDRRLIDGDYCNYFTSWLQPCGVCPNLIIPIRLCGRLKARNLRFLRLALGEMDQRSFLVFFFFFLPPPTPLPIPHPESETSLAQRSFLSSLPMISPLLREVHLLLHMALYAFPPPPVL